MDMSELEKHLQGLDPEDLAEVQKVIDRVKTAQDQGDNPRDDQDGSETRAIGQERRRDSRFQAEIVGSLKRLSDIRPGEKTEFTVTIIDISRKGMRLKASLNFLPSQAVSLIFSGPGGKVKQCYLEIIHFHRVTGERDSWLELGCVAIEEERVNQIRSREITAARMRKKLANKSEIYVYVVGPITSESKDLTRCIRSEGYLVHRIDNAQQVIERVSKTAAQLAIFCEGSKLCEDQDMLSEIRQSPQSLATLAIVDNEEDRFTLLKAGVDEYILRRELTDFLPYMIERALVGNAVRQQQTQQEHVAQALIITVDNTRAGLLDYQLNNNGLGCKVIPSPEQLDQINIFDFVLVFADFDPNNMPSFQAVRDAVGPTPLIALCVDFRTAPASQAQGADNYLCMPISEEDIRVILKQFSSATEELVR